MRVDVAHQLGKEAAIPVMDRCLDHLLGGLGSNIEILDKRTSWNGSNMRFSFTGRVGYISVPLAGMFPRIPGTPVFAMNSSITDWGKPFG